jgi:hypothetical protein
MRVFNCLFSISNFDSMWQWFFGQVAQENFVISDVAIKEVKQKI